MRRPAVLDSVRDYLERVHRIPRVTAGSRAVRRDGNAPDLDDPDLEA